MRNYPQSIKVRAAARRLSVYEDTRRIWKFFQIILEILMETHSKTTDNPKRQLLQFSWR
jgi:hypothetical protein